MQLLQQIGSTLYQVFTTPFFEIGGKHLALSSIVWLIVLAIGVFFAARILSRWIKLTVLARLGIDRGTQEAAATVISYLLTGFGIVIVLQSAGLNLSSLAVLAGVLGIGIGFGLQNLASNFISGITILFERPIKVGDFIEVDGLMGTVEKISIRSTVIRTIDGVRVITPNQHFVENKVVNWSYQDPRSRVRIPVSVAYGTDPVLVTEALLAAARQEKKILTNPSPKVWLVNFAENSLNFELLVWIDDPPERDFIKSSLNFLIEEEFRHREIHIPFPQRDLWIRNIHELKEVFAGVGQPDGIESGDLSSEIEAAETRKLAKQSTQNRTLRVLLRRIAYFEQFTDAELRSLIETGYRKFFVQDQIICKENDPGDSFYILLSGSVEVYSQRTGKYIATLHSGEFFGEIALLTGTPRSATVRALEDVIVFVVDRENLQKLLASHQDLAEQIAGKLAERQQVLQELGILDEGTLNQMGETPFTWIRKRILAIFGT
ncbi:MAG: mechanosensitive ion channel [Leptolyngbyaceae cyanobacterium bins.59]|nr:mechanosensitive ion channel [Leptolyngbyaceae cyanobacterium bins.59]